MKNITQTKHKIPIENSVFPGGFGNLQPHPIKCMHD